MLGRRAASERSKRRRTRRMIRRVVFVCSVVAIAFAAWAMFWKSDGANLAERLVEDEPTVDYQENRPISTADNHNSDVDFNRGIGEQADQPDQPNKAAQAPSSEDELKELLIEAMKDTGDNVEADKPIQKLLADINPRSAQELEKLKDRLVGAMTTYKQYFYEDALMTLEKGTSYKSKKRKQYEQHLIELGAITEQKIIENDLLMDQVAAKQPIPFKEGTSIVIDQELLRVLVENQKVMAMRVERVFQAYRNHASLPAAKTETDDMPTAVTLGLTADEVEAVMGKPDSVRNYRYKDDDWKYGSSSIRFDAEGKVNGWINTDQNLRVFAGVQDQGAPLFHRGSSRQQVAAAMGTPDSILDYKSSGSSWVYGTSRVDFNADGNVKGWVNTGQNLHFTNRD